MLERAIADARMVALESIYGEEALIPGQYTVGESSMRCADKVVDSKD